MNKGILSAFFLIFLFVFISGCSTPKEGGLAGLQLQSAGRLVSNWRFDGNFGGDSVGVNHGTGVNHAQIVDNALSLDGKDDYVVINRPRDLNMGNAITVSAWIKTTYNGGLVGGIVKRGANSTTLAGQEYALYLQGGRAYFVLGNGTKAALAGGYIVADGKWHMVTGVLRPDTNVEFYFDGVSKSKTKKTFSGVPGFALQSIGTLKNNSGFFKGMIDNVKIWNYALSATNIKSEFLAGRNGNVNCTNGSTRSCSTGLPGICASGTQTCTNGAWGTCNSNIAPGSRTETCNNLDDDCDGSTDEGLTRTCTTTNPGICAPGTQTCSAGTWGSCVPNVQPGSRQETCNNGIDDDCDGQVDENCASTAISIAAMRLGTSEGALIESKINGLLISHPNVDLIVTPEYLYYTGYEADPVIVSCGDVSCTVSSIGTTKSNSIKTAIEKMQSIASANRVNIVFGTIAEQQKIADVNVTFNTQLIIDSNGVIVGKKRKSTEWKTFPNINCYYDPSNPPSTEPCISIYNSALQTARAFSLKARNASLFKIIPLICGERNNTVFLDKLKNLEGDIIANSEREGDCNYTRISWLIQNDANTDVLNTTCWKWMMNDIFITKWVQERNIVKSGSYLVASESGSRVSGIVSLERRKLNVFQVTQDYVYGEIILPR